MVAKAIRIRLKPKRRRTARQTTWTRFPIKSGIYFASAMAILAFVWIGNTVQDSTPEINPVVYKPLLDTIAKGESDGNYNAHFSSAANTEIKFTEMTIEEVLDWQRHYVASGSVSNAVGRYQIIQPTLEWLVKNQQINPAEKFDEAMQDKMAIALLERRGSVEYATGQLNRDQFAHNIAQEWAALPKSVGSSPEESYYAGDGINQSLVSVAEIYAALDHFKNQA